MKERLDVLLVKQGLAESREKAKAVIMAGGGGVPGEVPRERSLSRDRERTRREPCSMNRR